MNILYRIFAQLAIGEMQFSDYFGDKNRREKQFTAVLR